MLVEDTVGRDGMPLRFDGRHGSVASFVSELLVTFVYKIVLRTEYFGTYFVGTCLDQS